MCQIVDLGVTRSSRVGGTIILLKLQRKIGPLSGVGFGVRVRPNSDGGGLGDGVARAGAE